MNAEGSRQAARLQELGAQYSLDERQSAQLERLLRILSGERAPTGVHGPERAVDAHLADSLAALELQAFAGAATIADLGSGAGIPGLVLAVARPGSEVRLVESQARKCAFLAEAVAELDLANAKIVCARAEQWEEGIGANDLVVARALAGQPIVLEYAAPLLRLGGKLVQWRGRRSVSEEAAARRAADALGMRCVEVRRVEPFAGASGRHLHVYEKSRATPARFPRRAGMARKRPLGA